MKRRIQFRDSSFKDPVCAMEVSRSTAAAEFEYRGKTFYFCAPPAGMHSRRSRRSTFGITVSMG
jgi:hypothetical protein